MTGGSPDEDEFQSNRRNRAISSAVITSLASKVGTVILQFVSIPIAYRVLGDDYNLYATIAVSIGTIILFQVGIGPALTHGISRAISNKNEVLQKQYFSTSWFLLLALTTIAGLFASLVFLFVPLTAIYGDKYSGLESSMLPGLWIALAIILLEFMLSHTERVREGFLEVHITNCFGAAGNVLGALTIIVGISTFQTIEFLILAIYGTRALVRLANTIFLFYQRPHLRPSFTYWNRPLAREMLSDGFAFSISHSLTSIVELNVCGLLVARFAGPGDMGHFQILMNLSGLMMGMIIMFTTPTWPAVVDALGCNNFRWIKSAIKKLWLLVSAYSLAVIIFLPTLGHFILGLIFGKEFEVGWQELLPFSIYFAVSAWTHTNNSLLIGMGLVKRAAIFSLIETLVLIVPAAIGIAFFGMPGLFSGMAITMIALTGWIFPTLLVKKVRTAAKGFADIQPAPQLLQPHED